MSQTITNPDRVMTKESLGWVWTKVKSALSGKVDKVTGKGLSTNDYTTEEKSKLGTIAQGAEPNVQANWDETDSTSDAYIVNKPVAITDAQIDSLFS